MAKKIDVLITPEGEVQITTSGYKGSSCLKATEALERALGAKSSDQPTAEMKQTETKQNARTDR